MTKQLGEMVALEFPGKLNVLPVQAVPKGRTVLLECADLIAGGMQRRALHKGRNPKDRLAEAVMNVTGFEDAADPGRSSSITRQAADTSFGVSAR